MKSSNEIRGRANGTYLVSIILLRSARPSPHFKTTTPMFTKEDYMRLPKERLAEMLVERDNDMDGRRITPETSPYQPIYPGFYPYYPWWNTKFEIT